MNAFVNTVLLVYAGLFPVVNPFGSAPLFLGMTEYCSGRQRADLALRVAVNSFFLLLGSVFMGSHVLEFFGISVPVVRIAGGIVVSAFGWRMLNSAASPDEHHPDGTGPVVPDSFYPLTMPLTVGPGSISVAVTLGSQRPVAAHIADLLLLGGGAILGLLLIAATIYSCYRFAERLVSALGPAGTNVVVRLSAFILLCIGIQIVWSGWAQLSGTH